MGFHDNGRLSTKMKEEILENGDLEPVRLTLLAQDEHDQEPQQPQAERPPVVLRFNHIADRLTELREPAANMLAPAAKYLAPAAGLVAPLAAMFRPSFLPKTGGKGKLRATAYLDGLRGFAALMVFCLHHQMWAHAFAGGSMYLENGFGFDGNYYFGALPVVRTFFTGGHFGVSVFFVISGYVLSTKPLSLINKAEYVALGDNLASALFRRWLRLYIPLIIITFMIAISPHVFGIGMTFKPEGNLKDEIWKWYCDIKNTWFIWDTGNRVLLDYHQHLWSIPVEFKASITIYTTLLAFSRCTRTARLWAEIGLWYYFMYIVDGAYFAMFMAGMIICDLEMGAREGYLPAWMKALAPLEKPIFYTMFAWAIWWGGIPSNSIELSHMRATPGWYYLSFLKPQAVFDYRWFFLHWASAFLVASVPHIGFLKRFFESRFCQYLGRVSYMFYALHGPILWTIGDRMYAAVGWVNETHILNMPKWANAFPLPRFGIFGLEFSYLAVFFFLLPLTLWVAELATTVLDDQSIKLTQVLYKMTLPENPAKLPGPGEKAPGSPKTEA
ncbi:hypothetical protein AC578_2782 [Pseudocercospora eumusae]|uniref:Acyltransferase 3 domain-containing protein n=1 Tax=Pseudocercospora eumusae TaxID=321146 RepID=A0A139HH09_9PEZI|nr:hypothetical protein AC578_2782 [Pseudocercospora eumusae]